MASVGVLRSVLILRIFSLLALATSAILMGLNNFTDFDGVKFKFTSVIAYRYVFACGTIGFVYTLLQIPFAIYNVVNEKRWIRNGCLQEFDFYGDKLMAFLLASGVGVGFGLTIELKSNFGKIYDDKMNAFFDRANVSTGILLAGFVSMALLSVLSSNRHTASIGPRTIFK